MKIITLINIFIIAVSASRATEEGLHVLENKAIVALKSDYKNNQQNFIKTRLYVEQLAYLSGKYGDVQYVDEAYKIVSTDVFLKSVDLEKEKLFRHVCLIKSSFMGLNERFLFLCDHAGMTKLDGGDDSFSVVLNATRMQMDSLKGGEKTELSFFVDAQESYNKQRLINELKYGIALLEFGDAVFYEESIRRAKINAILSQAEVNSEKEDEPLYYLFKLMLAKLDKDYEKALLLEKKIEEFSDDGNVKSYLIRQEVEKKEKGSADEFKNQGKRTDKSTPSQEG
ncbi:MAG: hypothetical protein KAU94_03655 [Verrucomicrobia bacterium]|nr:hypothetical protein [Verrucomicrobiota bacterium]